MFRATDIYKELQKRPFVPFRIHVSDGSHYDVLHPDFLVLMTNWVLILVPAANMKEPIFERYDSVALIHITRLEQLPQAAAPSSAN